MTVVNKQIIDCCHYFCWCEHIKTQICHANTSDLCRENMTRQIRFSRQIERFRAALKSKSTVCTKNKIMHFLQSQDSTSSHLQLFGRVSSLSSQLILHFGKTNDWESKWLNIVVSPVCNRHMRREVCQSFVHCWCPSISTANNIPHIYNSSLLTYTS